MPFQLIGREALWHSVLENCRTHILTFVFFWKSFCSGNVTSRLTFSMKLLLLLNLLAQCLHYVTEPFALSPLLQFSDTVETHNTWECALRQCWEAAWMENWTLMITDGELAYPNPYRANFFLLWLLSSLPEHWYIQQVVCHEILLSLMLPVLLLQEQWFSGVDLIIRQGRPGVLN